MEKKRFGIIIGVSAVMVCVCVAAILYTYLPKKSPFLLDSALNAQFVPSPVVMIASSSQRGEQPFYFLLNPEQQQELEDEVARAGCASLCVSLQVNSLYDKQIEKIANRVCTYGLLYQDDLVGTHKVTSVLEARPVITADLPSLYEHAVDKVVTLSFGFKRVPRGFWVAGVKPTAITGVHIARASVGWDKTCNFYAFPPAGGSVTFDTTSFDFSGSTELFAATNTAERLMPVITVGLVATDNFGTYEQQHAVIVKNGGETITIRRAPNQTEEVFPVASFVEPFARFVVVGGGESVTSVLMTASDASLLPREDGTVLYPYVCDPGLLIKWKKTMWRTHDYALLAWKSFPHVLLFDTANYSVQDDFFRRIAFFVEKVGYRGTLVSDEELGTKHGYNAHDYKADDLARFFNLAAQQHFPLNKRELLLCDILVANGILVEKNGVFEPGEGAVISVSQETPTATRRVLLAHEAYHGIYFSSEDFRNTVSALYLLTENDAMAFLKAFWKAQLLNYDESDSYLMQNEFMAYMMQRPLGETSKYFIAAARRPHVVAVAKDLSDYIVATEGQAFEEAAAVLNEYVFSHWGLAAGRISLVER